MTDVETFQSYRPLLFSIAYRMLGSASEAEDVVQDAYLRYAAASEQPIRSLKAYLSTIVSRLCLDRLKSAQTTREQYIGPWLPEPIIVQEGEKAMLQTVEQRESITLAFLVLLESLTPTERAVFLLREVFEYEYTEIGAMLEMSAANCRQIFHRAKGHLADQRPRFKPTPDQQHRLVERFLAAARGGDVSALTSMLTQDVVLQSDSGGKVPAARRPVYGPEGVARLIQGIFRQAEQLQTGSVQVSIEQVNGTPAVVGRLDGVVEILFTFSITNDQITAIQAVRNPDKLAYLRRQLDTTA